MTASPERRLRFRASGQRVPAESQAPPVLGTSHVRHHFVGVPESFAWIDLVERLAPEEAQSAVPRASSSAGALTGRYDAPYRWVNVAAWESEADFRATTATDEFRTVVTAPGWDEFPSIAVLFQVVTGRG